MEPEGRTRLVVSVEARPSFPRRHRHSRSLLRLRVSPCSIYRVCQNSRLAQRPPSQSARSSSSYHAVQTLHHRSRRHASELGALSIGRAVLPRLASFRRKRVGLRGEGGREWRTGRFVFRREGGTDSWRRRCGRLGLGLNGHAGRKVVFIKEVRGRDRVLVLNEELEIRTIASLQREVPADPPHPKDQLLFLPLA